MVIWLYILHCESKLILYWKKFGIILYILNNNATSLCTVKVKYKHCVQLEVCIRLLGTTTGLCQLFVYIYRSLPEHCPQLQVCTRNLSSATNLCQNIVYKIRSASPHYVKVCAKAVCTATGLCLNFVHRSLAEYNAQLQVFAKTLCPSTNVW